MNRLFYILVFSLLFTSCNQNQTQIEKEYIKNLEEKNTVLETELQELKSKTNSNNIDQGTKQKTKVSIDYFIIGSTEDKVIAVMGDPTTYIDFGSSGKRFNYGMSTVFFEKGKVQSYNNVEGNLKVKVKSNP
jgi:hypothetical protein